MGRHWHHTVSAVDTQREKIAALLVVETRNSVLNLQAAVVVLVQFLVFFLAAGLQGSAYGLSQVCFDCSESVSFQILHMGMADQTVEEVLSSLSSVTSSAFLVVRTL